MLGTCESTYRPLTPAFVGAREWPSATLVHDTPERGIILHSGNGTHHSVAPSADGPVTPEILREFWDLYNEADARPVKVAAATLVKDAISDGVLSAVEARRQFDVGDFLVKAEDDKLTRDQLVHGFSRLRALGHIRHLSPALQEKARSYLT